MAKKFHKIKVKFQALRLNVYFTLSYKTLKTKSKLKSNLATSQSS